MGIITISRGTKSGGILVAEEIGKRLNAKVVSRPMLVEAANLKSMENSLWYDIKDRPARLMEDLLPMRHAYITKLRATLLEMASKEESLVYHANGGQLLLRDVSCALRARIVAPMDMRLKMVVERRGGTIEDAGIYIREKDENRSMWNRFLYGVNSIDNPVFFDLIVNLEKYGVEQAADMIIKSTEYESFKREATCHMSLTNVTLASKVSATIANNPKTKEIRISVIAEEGVVVLKGNVLSESDIEAAVDVAKGVEGVGSVQSQLTVK